MPANKKYLISSPWTKTGKIIASILGAWLVSLSFHMALALWIDMKSVLVTSAYSIFIVWSLLMLVVYWIKSPWKVWGIFLLSLIICILAIYFGKTL
ncbi:MAG: hypothetical protein MI975_04000 [Cytophagales bacterium]|nr:hypothetical protein [Cytophagales bacterium]